MSTTVVAVRLDKTRAEMVRLLAQINETSIAYILKHLVGEYINSRMVDRAVLDQQIKESMERHRLSLSPLLQPDLDTFLVQPCLPPSMNEGSRATQAVFRLSEDRMKLITAIATLDGWSIADEVRASIDEYTGTR